MVPSAPKLSYIQQNAYSHMRRHLEGSGRSRGRWSGWVVSAIVHRKQFRRRPDRLFWWPRPLTALDAEVMLRPRHRRTAVSAGRRCVRQTHWRKQAAGMSIDTYAVNYRPQAVIARRRRRGGRHLPHQVHGVVPDTKIVLGGFVCQCHRHRGRCPDGRHHRGVCRIRNTRTTSLRSPPLATWPAAPVAPDPERTARRPADLCNPGRSDLSCGSGQRVERPHRGPSPDTTQAATVVAGMLLTGFGQTVPGYGPPPGYGPTIPGYGPDTSVHGPQPGYSPMPPGWSGSQPPSGPGPSTVGPSAPYTDLEWSGILLARPPADRVGKSQASTCHQCEIAGDVRGRRRRRRCGWQPIRATPSAIRRTSPSGSPGHCSLTQSSTICTACVSEGFHPGW